MPTNAVSFAQAHCMALLEGKLKELQALRRSLQPASPYAHATLHHHQPPVIHPQDHNTFTRNDAGPGLSSAGAAPAPLATRCPKAQPITLPIITAGSLALAQAAKRLARRRRPRARRPLKRRRRRPLRRRRRQARSPSHSLKCHEAGALFDCSSAAERRAPPPKRGRRSGRDLTPGLRFRVREERRARRRRHCRLTSRNQLVPPPLPRGDTGTDDTRDIYYTR